MLGAVEVIARQMLEARLPELSPAQARVGADLLSRMLISYAVRPPAGDPAAVARFLSTAVVAGVIAAPADPS